MIDCSRVMRGKKIISLSEKDGRLVTAKLESVKYERYVECYVEQSGRLSRLPNQTHQSRIWHELESWSPTWQWSPCAPSPLPWSWLNARCNCFVVAVLSLKHALLSLTCSQRSELLDGWWSIASVCPTTISQFGACAVSLWMTILELGVRVAWCNTHHHTEQYRKHQIR